MSGPGPAPAVLGCLAVALVMLPAPAARRRFDAVFRTRRRVRKPRIGRTIRLAACLAPVAVIVLGVGPMLAAVCLAGTFGLRRRRSTREQHRADGCAQLLEGLETVIGELRIGAHPSAAAAIAARETKGEVAHAFAVSAARSRLGGSGADGLRQSEAAVSQELSRIADAWQVAEEHGLALAELLSAARLDLLGRRRFRDRTRAALAGARATAAVLALLPLLGIGLGQLMGAAPLHILFAAPAGTVLLPLGAALSCAGLLWTDAITERVLR
ncbi:type II secretion system F family protein [Nocardia inohanensis]|uniref:type II secretion system F family protein n=1 Tax=Nocardia inohanensis TaxID=209246 RepID=UPI00082BCDFF|nr:type II secretion system F family protein [Nocardia inohanensis]